jgi:AraC family transcriptional regulator of adaptative response / DNA-3-methyladenine glycosylase II
MCRDNLFGHLAATAIPGVEEWRDGAYRRTLRLPHGPGVVSLRPGAEYIACQLALTDLRDLAMAISRCRRMLDLDADPVAICEQLSADPVLAPLVGKAPGRRIPRTVDGAEFAIRAVLGQQVSTAAARTHGARLARDYGERIEDPAGGLTRLFPAMAALAGADYDLDVSTDSPAGAVAAGGSVTVVGADAAGGPVPVAAAAGRARAVAGAGPVTSAATAAAPAAAAPAGRRSGRHPIALPRARRQTLLALARALADGDIDLGAGAHWQRARMQLSAVPGLGPWSVELIAMRGLGDPDAFTPTDLGVRQAARELGLPASPAALTRHAASWRPWRGYAVQYLWATSDHAINRLPA